ncbi:MAG: chemotaxis response regulator protein-glutamate methylesterase [Clostridiaceae bacterium]
MPVRMMVVDDSAFMRKIIGDAVSEISGIEIVGFARNGIDALESIPRLMPDIVTMDIEMPKMNGIEALKLIKKDYTKVQVIMLSSYSKAGSEVTMEALELGALDFIEKPQNSGQLGLDELKTQLEIKLAVAIDLVEGEDSTQRKYPAKSNLARKPSFERDKVKAIVIGASTGGPKVLFDIIKGLPEDLNIPVFIVQHMPKGFTKSFAQRLNSECSLTVVEAKHEMSITHGMVYVAPGDYHMTIEKSRIILDERPKIHGVRPAVDLLFETAARRYGNELLGVILTGMGKDGAAGMVSIKEAGGYNLAQDKESCIVYGMPGYAVSLGVVDEILSPEKIIKNIVSIVRGKNGIRI